MRKKIYGKNPVLVDGFNVDLIVEQVLNKLLEFANSKKMLDDEALQIVKDDEALQIVKSVVPELENYNLVDTIPVEGSTPLFVLEKKSLDEARYRNTGSSKYQENEAFKQLKTKIDSLTDNGKNTITLYFKTDNKTHGIYTNVYDVSQPPNSGNNPVADFIFSRRDENGRELPAMYLSHKGGDKPSDFRQLSGVSQRKRPEINKHLEVQKFKTQYENWLRNNEKYTEIYKGEKRLKSNIVVAKVIIDENLMRQAMHGQHTLRPERGEHAVDFLAQGKFSFEEKNIPGSKHLVISAPKMLPFNFDFKDLPREIFPVLTIRPDTKQWDEGFPYSRMTIYPHAGAHGEKDPYRAAKKEVIWLP